MNKNNIYNTRKTGKELKKEHDNLIGKTNFLESRIRKRLLELINIYPNTPYYNNNLKISEINEEVLKALRPDKIIDLIIFMEEFNNKNVKQKNIFD